MKRHPALQDLSREHHTALVLARHIGACADDADAKMTMCERVAAYVDGELAPHLDVEEATLVPRLGGSHEAAAQRILADHATLRALAARIAAADADALPAFGALLAEHVRFEERTAFPLLEALFVQDGHETAVPVAA